MFVSDLYKSYCNFCFRHFHFSLLTIELSFQKSLKAVAITKITLGSGAPTETLEGPMGMCLIQLVRFNFP